MTKRWVWFSAGQHSQEKYHCDFWWQGADEHGCDGTVRWNLYHPNGMGPALVLCDKHRKILAHAEVRGNVLQDDVEGGLASDET